MKDTKIEPILDSLIKSLEQGHSEKLKEYFSVLSRFHNYSWHNQIGRKCIRDGFNPDVAASAL